jgi:hypothetical protein
MFVATKHAEIRLRQRGIPLTVVEWLVSYGSSHFDHHGGLVFYLDSRSRAVLRSAIDRDALVRYSEHLNCYVVMSTNGEVITVGHRTRRFRLDSANRHRSRRRRHRNVPKEIYR